VHADVSFVVVSDKCIFKCFCRDSFQPIDCIIVGFVNFRKTDVKLCGLTCVDNGKLISSVQNDGKTTSLVLELLQVLVPSVVERCRESSALGSMARAQDELKKLEHLTKTVETTDHLMVNACFPCFSLLCSLTVH